MAKVEYAFPVEKIHGKVSKSHKVGFAHRVDSNLNYTQTYGQRNYNTHPVTSKESAICLKFTTVAAAVRARQIDPTKMAADQAAFLAQNKYKRMWGFLWNLEWEAYQA